MPYRPVLLDKTVDRVHDCASFTSVVFEFAVEFLYNRLESRELGLLKVKFEVRFERVKGGIRIVDALLHDHAADGSGVLLRADLGGIEPPVCRGRAVSSSASDLPSQ